MPRRRKPENFKNFEASGTKYKISEWTGKSSINSWYVWCCPWTWWINRPALSQSTSGSFLAMRQSRHACSSQREAPSEFFCRYLPPFPHHMIQLPPSFEASQAESSGKGYESTCASSIAGWFCRLSWQAYAVGSVAPDVCLLVREAA